MYKRITHGSYNQGHGKYGDSRGKQCVAMVLSYFLYTERIPSYNIGKWDIDTILDMGNSIYIPVSHVTKEKYLLPSDLPTVIEYGNKMFEAKITASISGLLCYDVSNLLEGLQKAFGHGNRCYFTCSESCIGIVVLLNVYYVFDAHACDHRGYKSSTGVSAQIMFNNIENLALYLRIQFHHDNDKQYQIIPVVITDRGCLDTRHMAHIQVNKDSINTKALDEVPIFMISQKTGTKNVPMYTASTSQVSKVDSKVCTSMKSDEQNVWTEVLPKKRRRKWSMKDDNQMISTRHIQHIEVNKDSINTKVLDKVPNFMMSEKTGTKNVSTCTASSSQVTKVDTEVCSSMKSDEQNMWSEVLAKKRRRKWSMRNDNQMITTTVQKSTFDRFGHVLGEHGMDSRTDHDNKKSATCTDSQNVCNLLTNKNPSTLTEISKDLLSNPKNVPKTSYNRKDSDIIHCNQDKYTQEEKTSRVSDHGHNMKQERSWLDAFMPTNTIVPETSFSKTNINIPRTESYLQRTVQDELEKKIISESPKKLNVENERSWLDGVVSETSFSKTNTNIGRTETYLQRTVQHDLDKKMITENAKRLNVQNERSWMDAFSTKHNNSDVQRGNDTDVGTQETNIVEHTTVQIFPDDVMPNKCIIDNVPVVVSTNHDIENTVTMSRQSNVQSLQKRDRSWIDAFTSSPIVCTENVYTDTHDINSTKTSALPDSVLEQHDMNNELGFSTSLQTPCVKDSDISVPVQNNINTNEEMFPDSMAREHVNGIRSQDSQPDDSISNQSKDISLGKNLLSKLDGTCDYVCCSCHQIFFARSVDRITQYTLRRYSDYIDNRCEAVDYYVCNTCQRTIRQGRVPVLSHKNGMRFPDRPTELDIHRDEEMLISLRIMFLNIVLLPRGSQMSLMGNVINVPADIEYGICQLPRYINHEGTVSVRIKRCLRFKGVYRKINVRPYKVINALKWLMANSTMYKQYPVYIDNDWLDKTIDYLIANRENDDILHANESECVEATINISDDPRESGTDIFANVTDLGKNEDMPNTDIDVTETPNDNIIRSKKNYHSDETGIFQSNTNNMNDGENVNVTDSDDQFSEIDPGEGAVTYNTLLDQNHDLNYLDIAPGECNRPIPLLYDHHGEEMAYPTIYCGYKMDDLYPDGIHLSQRFRWELRHRDRRVAQHPDKIFAMYKKYQANFIQGKQTFALRLLKNKEYKCSDVKNSQDLLSIAGVNDGFYFFNTLRNSPMYFQARKRELLAFIRQRGIPTFFVSLSSADLHWIPLLRSLCLLVDKKVLTDEEVQELDFRTKCRLINSDPVTTARFFDNRMQVFIREILYHPSHPIGDVIDHFYKIEFQHRGSPHVHMLIWVKDAPKYDGNPNNTDIPAFIDKYISCALGDHGINTKYINIQKHAHSRTCRKRGKNVCRFGFPLPPMRKTMILKCDQDSSENDNRNYEKISDILAHDQTITDMSFDEFLKYLSLSEQEYLSAIQSNLQQDKIFLKREPSEIRVNGYMQNLYPIWKGNHDIQFCLSTYSLIMYIITYIQKTNRGTSLSLSKLVKEMKKDGSLITDQIKKIGKVFLNTSEISIQECIYILLGLPMCYISRQVVYISTQLRTDRIRVLKDREYLDQLSDDSVNICYDSIFEKYEQRPMIFQEWCLADFITKLNIKSVKYSGIYNDDDDDNNSEIHVPDLPERVLWRDSDKEYCLRRTDRIIRFDIPCEGDHLNELHRINLLLFHPWWNEVETFKEGTDYGNVIENLLPEQLEKYEDRLRYYNIENQKDLQELENLANEEYDSGNVAPSTDHADMNDVLETVTPSTDKDFFIPNIDRNATSTSNEDEHIYTDNTQREHLHTQVERLWNHEKILEAILLLNEKQTIIYEHIMKHVLLNDDPFYIFITGGAGVGKSLLLRTLYNSLSRFYNLKYGENPSMNSVLCASYTGKAAFIINGETIHSCLAINPSRTYSVYISPNSDTLNRLRNKWRDVKMFMIDEVSFLGSTLFNFVNLRLQDIYGTKKIFGGIPLIVFGDMFQLSPIADNWIFMNSRGLTDFLGPNLWKGNFKYFQLTEIMRQKKDQKFAQILNRIRSGIVDNDDIQVLKTRLGSVDFSKEEIPQILCSRNVDVNTYNKKIYDHSQNKKCTVHSRDHVLSNMSYESSKIFLQNLSKDPTKTGCLENILNLCEGLMYDIIINIDVIDGLVNGANGRLKYMQYYTKVKNPAILWFDFANTKVGEKQRKIYKQFYEDGIDTHWVPIFPITRKFNVGKKFIEISRTQFPIKQSSAKTVHKSQGSTYNEVIVDLKGPYYNYFKHMVYVALSRVKTLNGLTLIQLDSKSIKIENKVVEENIEGTRDRSITINFRLPELQYGTLNLYYENAQSFRTHFENIKNSLHLRNQHVLLFCETKMGPSDTDNMFHIENYQMIRMDQLPRGLRRSPHGLLVYLENDLPIQNVYNYVEQDIEYVTIETTYCDKQYIICLLYKAPKCSNMRLFNALKTFRKQYSLDHKILLVGDFNVDLSESQHHNVLQTMCDITNLVYSPSGPTTRDRTIIDLTFSNDITSIETLYVPWSHHMGLAIRI